MIKEKIATVVFWEHNEIITAAANIVVVCPDGNEF
jgi:hypothetical protein